MKNYLIILLTIVTLSSTYSQVSKDSLFINETQAERIIDKYVDKIADSFNTGIEKITPTVKEGFNIVVRLQLAKGIAYILPLFSFIIFFILYQKEYNRISKKCKEEDSDYGPFDEIHITPLLIINIGITIILCIMTLIYTYDGITHILVPEWFAIKEIIGLF